MAQDGQLLQKGTSWFARWYSAAGERKTKKLGDTKEFPTRDDIQSTFQSFMAEINASPKKFIPTATTTVSQFVREKYFPEVEKELRGSTIRAYKIIWNLVEPKLGHLRVRDVRTFDCQNVMDAIVAENKHLKKNSLFRIKSFMSAIFNEAIRAGLRRDDKNPVASDRHGNGGIKVRGVKGQRKTETFAYALDDIRAILNALTEPSRVLLAIAAFSGLRRSEIVGLRWEDYDGEFIWVRRNICFGQKGEMSVELPKTEASDAPVPVIPPLRVILDAWKAKATVTEGCWIFPAQFTRKKDHPATLLDAARMTPLSPANILRDAVLPALEKAGIEWQGYHAFRRGLATNLKSFGVDDLTISQILRHSDVSVTRASYIKRVPEQAVAAMNRFARELAKNGVAHAAEIGR